MTVAGNMEYPLKKRRMPKVERRERVAKAARMLQLDTLLGRKPKELSGGQQQRVALGRALVRNPAVFLLDEPLSNLDAKLRAHMRAELIQLHRRIGRTMVYVTHDQLEAMTMSDRIAVFRDGCLQQFASPREIYAHPANEFVAGFIGTPSMNFIDGQLQRRGGETLLSCGDWCMPLPDAQLADTVFNGSTEPAVRAGWRPEDVEMHDDGHDARVLVVELAGHELIVVFDFLGSEVVGRFEPGLSMQPDDNVKLLLRPEKLHFFSPHHGSRLNIV
jgi:multiple sugar transport system ATP-binding protein